MTRRTKKVALPSSKTITLSGDLEAKLHYDNLPNDIVENTVNQIKKVDGEYPNFKALVENNAHKPLQFYVYNDRDSYQKHTESTSKYGYFDHSSNTMYTYIDPNDNDPFLIDAMQIAQNERVLPKKYIVQLNDNLEAILHYNNLSDKKLKTIEQRIKDNFNEYEELFGIDDHGTAKTITFFLHDNKKDFDDYGYSYANYLLRQFDLDRTNILNAYHYVGHSNVPLREQISYALSYHNVSKSLAMLTDRVEVIELPKSNVQIKLDTNDLSNEEVKTAKKEIINTFMDIKFDTHMEISLDRYSVGDDVLVSLLRKVRPREDYDHESAKEALEDPIIQRDMPILLSDKTKVEKSQMLLAHKEIIEFPRYNFEVEFYHNLKGYALERAKQEIINNVYDFKEAFGLRAEHPKNPDITSKFRIFAYENGSDFYNYGGIAGGYAEGAGCDIYIANAYTYQGAPSEAPIQTIRHEFGHALANYINGCRFPEDPIGEGMAAYPQRQFHPLNSAYESRVYGEELVKEIQSSAVLDISPENYLYRIPAFFAEIYPEVMKDIFQNRTLYNNPLEHFKNKFPFLVSHISSKESFDSYGYKFLSRIFEKPEIKQKFLDFVKSKVAESKYIDEVRDLNAFRVVKGDHIGTDKNTDEEYYIGMIVDDRGEIGAFSPVEYSFSRGEIKALNHATQDSIIIPKQYHNLKLVKVDSNYKLAFCDKGGNEYRDAQACRNQTKDFLYTDNAQEAFALVDLHSLQGITGKEENLGKIFSIKPTNSKSIISIYDGRKETGSFTNEIGYINKNKFYFKNEHSTDFKIYDKNRALIIITKENDEYKLSLADGNYIDDDNKFLKQSTELSGNAIDVHDTHSKGTAITEFFEKEDTLLFRYGPGPENEKTMTLSDGLKAKLYYESISDDIVENIVNQIKEVEDEYPNFKALIDNNVSKSIQFYVYDTRNSYKAHTGSDSKYGHYDHSSNTMYTYRDPDDVDAFLSDATQVAHNERVLPKKDIVQLDDDMQVVLHYNKLDAKELKAIKHKIKDAFDEYEELFGIEDHGTKTITFFLHDNKEDYDNYGYSYANYLLRQFDLDQINILNAYHYVDGNDVPLRMQVSYALSHHNVGKGLAMLSEREEPLEDEIQDEGELDEEEVIDLSQYNLKVRIHYNDLSDDQLGAAEKEIKKTFSDFNKSFKLEKSNSPRELQLYIYDNRGDFTKHTGSDAAGIASPYWNGDNVAKMSIYKLDDDGVGFTEYLRHELAHGLTFYCNGSPGLTCGGKADYGLTSFLLEGIAYYIHEGSNLPGGSTFNPEDYYKDGHKLVSLLERCYPKVIDSIIHNNNLYKNALKHFKAEFPNLVSHISDDESFSVYDEAFFERIFDNDEVVRTFEENYNNISEDLSDMSYKMINGSLRITDSETGDTVKMPKKFKYLKLEEDDEGEYGLALCDKKGRALSDNKKYAKMDDKYKYLDTKAVNLDEDIEFGDYDEGDIFSMKADKSSPQIIRIFDYDEEEIGMLSNNDFI